MSNTTTDKKDKVSTISLDVTQGALEQFKNLQEKSHSESTLDVIRRALAFYDMCVDHQIAGGQVVLVNADESKEVARSLIG